MNAMGNKTNTRTFDNTFLSDFNCENIESVARVNSHKSYIVPPEVLKRRQEFWEQFFVRYSDQFTDDIELDITTLKPCKSECRSQITPRSVVQHWVNTGYLPYHISIKKVERKFKGKPIINYVKPCYDGSSLSSSVDTAAYILQNINTTNKERRMAIMGEAKPQSSTSFCDTFNYENAETTQRTNDKIHECNAKNNINNSNDTNNHPRCAIISDIFLRPFQQTNTDLKENIFMLNKIVNTSSPLFDNSKSNSCELLNKSCEPSDNKIDELPNDKSHELPNNELCELSSSESCELFSNKSCELPNNTFCELQHKESCELPNKTFCELQNKESYDLQNNKSCELQNNKSCELQNNKSCEIPNNKSCKLQNNESCETLNNKPCETLNNKPCETPNSKSQEPLSDMLSKSQSTSMYSKRSYLEKSLLDSDVIKIRHRKKLYTGRNSPVDLVTMKNCNKQVLCKLQQNIHPALDFGYSLPNKLNIKKRKKIRQSCIISKNLQNVSQVISNYKRSAKTENGQNYFDLLHMTLASQSVITNDKDDNEKNKFNNTMVQLKKICSKTHKKSNNTLAQSKNLNSIVQTTKLSRNNSLKCTKKPNKHTGNLKNLNPTVLLTKLSNLDIQKYKKLNNLLHNVNPVIRLRQLAKFDIQKYKKATNIMKNRKYLNAIVSLEKLSETAIKRYKTTTRNVKKYSETNLLSDTSPLPYSVNKYQHFLNNTINSLQSSNVIEIKSTDTDSDQSTVLMYRCNSKTSGTLSISNVSVFSNNTYKDVQSKKSIDDALHICTNSHNIICSTPSPKSKIISENNNNDNAHTFSGKMLKLCTNLGTSDSADELIKRRYYLRTKNSQDNLGSTLSHKSEIIPENNNNVNVHTTRDKKMKLNSTAQTSNTDDALIKPRHSLSPEYLQNNLYNALCHKPKIIPKNNNDDNVNKTSDKKMELSSTVQTSDTDGIAINPTHYLRPRNSQDNLGSTLAHKSEIIPENNNNDNAHTTSDKKIKLSATIKTSDSSNELLKPRHYLRPRNSQDNLGSTLAHKSEIIPENNNDDNAHTTSDKKIKLSATVKTSDSSNELLKPRHYLRPRNSQDNLGSTLAHKSEIIPENNNDDNAHTTSDKKIKLSATIKTSDSSNELLKPRHYLRPRNSQDNLGSTLAHKSEIIPENNNDDNAHTTSDKKIKLSATVKTSDSSNELLKPRHYLRPRNSQDNLGSTLSHKSEIIPENNNDDNAHTTSDKKIKLSATVKTSDSSNELLKPRHYLRPRNSQDNLGSTLAHKSEIIPENNNDDNAHTISGKKVKLSSTSQLSDTNSVVIKPRHYLRSRNSKDILGNTLSHKSEIIPKNNNNVNIHTTRDKKMKLNSTAQTSNTDYALIKPRHFLRSKETINVTKEQSSNEFKTSKPCRKSGSIKSRMEAGSKSPTESLQHNTKFWIDDNSPCVNHIHFETNLFDSTSDADFNFSIF